MFVLFVSHVTHLALLIGHPSDFHPADANLVILNKLRPDGNRWTTLK